MLVLLATRYWVHYWYGIVASSSSSLVVSLYSTVIYLVSLDDLSLSLVVVNFSYSIQMESCSKAFDRRREIQLLFFRTSPTTVSKVSLASRCCDDKT